jgi:hypothetical protein
LINFITPVVRVVHVFAGFLGEVSSLVSREHSFPSDGVLIFNPSVPRFTRKGHFCWC